MHHVRDFDDVTIIKLETRISRALDYATYVPFVDGLLIDSGFCRARKDLKRGLGDRRVVRVANTHAHEDHFGNNTWVERTFDAEVVAPELGLDDMMHPERVALNSYQKAVWGVPEPSRAKALEGQVHTDRFTFDVIPTPGHSPDHVCFFEPKQGWLFSGDLFLSYKVRLARPFENANDLLRSLETVRDLEPKILFCYHRGVMTDPHEALTTKIDFMQTLRDGIHELHDKGVQPRAIARSLLGKDPLGFRLTDFSKRNLVEAFLKPSSAPAS